MQLIKEILKIIVLSIAIIILVVIFNINWSVVNNMMELFVSVYWFFYLLLIYFFIYIFIYLLVVFYIFKNKIIQLNYITILLFTVIFYVSAEFFTAKNERIDIVGSSLIIFSCSVLIYYVFKKIIK